MPIVDVGRLRRCRVGIAYCRLGHWVRSHLWRCADIVLMLGGFDGAARLEPAAPSQRASETAAATCRLAAWQMDPLPLLGYCLLLLVLLSEAVPHQAAEMPLVVQSAADAADPAVRWFSNELDLPCAPGWGGFLCNEKLLPEGWVPTDLPPVNTPVRLNPVRAPPGQPGSVRAPAASC